jgi:hypothetical protein
MPLFSATALYLTVRWSYKKYPYLSYKLAPSSVGTSAAADPRGAGHSGAGPSTVSVQSEAPGFSQYLTEERGMSKLTVARYLRYLNRFADYLRLVEVTSLRDLSPQLLSSFNVSEHNLLIPNNSVRNWEFAVGVAVVGAAVPVFPRRVTKFAQGDDQERARKLLRRRSDAPSRRSASTLA